MKKLFLFLLLIPSLAFGDLGVVVTQSGTVIAKEVYSGNTSGVAAVLTARQTADPTLSFQTFTLPNGTFDGTAVPVNQAPLRASAITYIATDPGPQNKVTRALMLVVRDEINVLRTALSLTPLTVNQLQNAVQAKINAGTAD